jgi:hypothetical protein
MRRCLQISTTVALVHSCKSRTARAIRASDHAPKHICVAVNVGVSLYEATLHASLLLRKRVDRVERLIGSRRSRSRDIKYHTREQHEQHKLMHSFW